MLKTGGRWPQSLTGPFTQTVTLDQNFDQYLNPEADVEADGKNTKFAGQTQRLAGTLTWAVVCRSATAVPTLRVDHVKADIFTRTGKPTEAIYTASAMDPTPSWNLNCYARVANGSSVSSQLRAFKGSVRLTLNTVQPPTGGGGSVPGKLPNNDLNLVCQCALQNPIPGTSLRLRAVRPDQQGRPHLDDLTHVLVTVDSAGTVSYPDSNQTWTYYNDLPSAWRPYFEEAFVTFPSVAPQTFVSLELVVNGVDKVVASYPISPDWDDDGLTRIEEEKYHTSETCRDSDGDGLLDGEEISHLGFMAKVPFAEDPEIICDPFKVDSDDDGLADGLELGLTHAGYDFNGVHVEGLVDRERVDQCLNVKTVYYSEYDQNQLRCCQFLGITGTKPPLVGDIHEVSGLRLVDADPTSWTDPTDPDTDGDGFWDGAGRLE